MGTTERLCCSGVMAWMHDRWGAPIPALATSATISPSPEVGDVPESFTGQPHFSWGATFVGA